MSEPTLLELLKAVQFALNSVASHKLRGCPGGYKNTYELAARVDAAIYFRQENKDDADV